MWNKNIISRGEGLRGNGQAAYLAIGSVGLFFVGAATGVFLNPLDNSEKDYQSGFQAARNLVEGSSIGTSLRTPDDMRTLVGTVTAVNGASNLTLHVQLINPFENQMSADRTVLLSPSTIVKSVMQKNIEEFKAEQADFIKASKGSTVGTTTPPSPFVVKDIKISDIKVGDSISVSALENIKTKTQFFAHDIQISDLSTNTKILILRHVFSKILTSGLEINPSHLVFRSGSFIWGD